MREVTALLNVALRVVVMLVTNVFTLVLAVLARLETGEYALLLMR